jgi:hypothetical protein
MEFDLLGEARGRRNLRDGQRHPRTAAFAAIYGPGRWRMRKGCAQVRLADGTICRAEVHWHESHGMSRKEMNIKRLLDE